MGPAGENRLRRTVPWQHPLITGHQVPPGLHGEASSLAFLAIAPQNGTQSLPRCPCGSSPSGSEAPCPYCRPDRACPGPSHLQKAWNRAALSGPCLAGTEGGRPVAEPWASESHVLLEPRKPP